MHTLPKGARETSRRKVTGAEARGARCRCSAGDGDFASIKFDDKLVDAALEGEDVFDKIFFGIPNGPEEFIARALKAGHPRSLDAYSSQLVNETVKANFIDEPFEVAKVRTSFFKKWTKRAQELQSAEDAANECRPAHLREILRGTRLLLWKEILTSLGYPDAKVIDEACRVFTCMVGPRGPASSLLS